MSCLAAGVAAQTIERMRLTDNDLGCAQIYAESQQMDTAIKLAGGATYAPQPVTTALAYPAQQPAPTQQQQLTAVQQAVLNHPNNANLSPEQKATLIAQTGMAEARGNAAVAGLYGSSGTAASRISTQGGIGGGAAAAGIAGLFGALSGSVPAAPGATAPAAAALTTRPPMPQGNLVAQAQARKEHLTTMFLSRGCKLADVQK